MRPYQVATAAAFALLAAVAMIDSRAGALVDRTGTQPGGIGAGFYPFWSAAIVFLWKEIDRQVSVTGGVRRVEDDESDAYFATRPREAQIGAWASPQSSVLSDRRELEERVGDVSARFRDAPIPRPPHWGGYRLTPDAVEFWQGRPFRLHDRFLYTRDGDDRTGWRVERLSP